MTPAQAVTAALEIALERAESVLADRRVFQLDTRRWKAFLAALDARAKWHPRLARLFNEPGVFD